MNDVTRLIQPKSDQMNYEDLIGGAITGTITRVDTKQGGEQPISVHLDNFDRPWKPCKSMARVMVFVWGSNSTAWVGHQVRLFGDPTVKWAGAMVGGIRIEAVSGINRPVTVNLTVSRGKRNPFVIQPISNSVKPVPIKNNRHTGSDRGAETTPPNDGGALQSVIDHHREIINMATSLDQLAEAWGRTPINAKAALEADKDSAKERLSAAQSQPETVANESQDDGIENF